MPDYRVTHLSHLMPPDIPSDPVSVADKVARDELVDIFSNAIKTKLDYSARKGRAGWDAPFDWSDDARRQLRECVEKGDPIDVAAFAMFLWNMGRRTA